MYTATFSNRIMQYHLFSYSTFTASNFAQLSCINTIIIFYLEARTRLALPRIALARVQNYSAILKASFFLNIFVLMRTNGKFVPKCIKWTLENKKISQKNSQAGKKVSNNYFTSRSSPNYRKKRIFGNFWIIIGRKKRAVVRFHLCRRRRRRCRRRCWCRRHRCRRCRRRRRRHHHRILSWRVEMD